MTDEPLNPLDRTTRPERVQFVLDHLTADENAEIRTMQLARLVKQRFGVSITTAHGDIKIARAKLADAINEAAPWLGASVKDSLLRIARKAETAGRYDWASDAMFRLGKFLGLHEKSDSTVAAQLSAEELQAQLDAAIAARIEAMDPAELAAILARKADPSPTSTAGEPAAVTIGKEP